jgi:hypothetical protein
MEVCATALPINGAGKWNASRHRAEIGMGVGRKRAGGGDGRGADTAEPMVRMLVPALFLKEWVLVTSKL